MSKPKLILYSHELPLCPCYDRIFRTEFEVETTHTEEEFLRQMQAETAEAAVVCFCSARKKDVEKLLRLEALSGPLPVLTCSRSLNPGFIRSAGLRGVDRFLLCDMGAEKIRDLILEAIRQGGLRDYLESCYPCSLTASPYMRKMIDEIVRTFPHRLKEGAMAQRLGISQRWFQKICQQAFGITYTHFVRRIWVHQALRLMQHTNLDNIEIALQLNYSEESSLARDFRKELGYSPGKARRRLTKHTPEDLLR
jgi:AraC-like DNA-binding protein